MSDDSLARQKERILRVLIVAECLMGLLTLVSALLANSTALYTNAARVGLDILLCAVSLVTVRMVGRRHARFDYGLGKLENLTVLFVTLVMGAALVGIVRRSMEGLLMPRVLEGTAPGLVALGLACVGNAYFYLRFRRLHAHDGSPVMEGQMHLYRNAGAATIFALVAVAAGSHASANHPWLLRLDPLAGLLLAGLVAQSTCRLARRSLLGLLDATVDEPLQQAINRELARHVESYDALHGVRARYSGTQVRVELFLGFSAELSGAELLARCKSLKADLEAALPHSEVWVVPSDAPPSAL